MSRSPDHLPSLDLPGFSAWFEDQIAAPDTEMLAVWQQRVQEIGDPALPPTPERFEPLGPVRRLVVHHSETLSGSIEHFRWLHRVGNGWSDIGYHWVIGNGADGLSTPGEVRLGRPDTVQGAHVRGHNADSIGICLVGNFDLSLPGEAALSALRELLGRLLERYGLGAEDILGHREFSGVTKTCPGNLFDMERVRNWFREPTPPSEEQRQADALAWFARGHGLAETLRDALEEGSGSGESPDLLAHQGYNALGFYLKSLLVWHGHPAGSGFGAEELLPPCLALQPELSTISGLGSVAGYFQPSPPGEVGLFEESDLRRMSQVLTNIEDFLRRKH